MREVLQERVIDCPYCGERVSLTIDCSAGDQDYYEDCHVCCRPIQIAVRLATAGDRAELRIRREDE